MRRSGIATGLICLLVTAGAAAGGGAGVGPAGISVAGSGGAATRGPASDRHAPVQADVPVLLVPGWSDTERDLAPLRIRLVAGGWPESHVVPLTFEDPTGENGEHAEEIARAVEALCSRTGAERVDIVAHSMGGLATRKYLEDLGGGARVRRVVLLATPNQGTYTAYLAFGGGRDEMLPGSPFLAELNADPPLPSGVRLLTVRTILDTHIVPGESATLPGVEDVQVCCPTHDGLLRDEEVFRLVRRFLSDGVVEEEVGR